MTETERYPLRVDGLETYVEPQLLAPVPGGFVLAGSPVYEWRSGPDGIATFERDRILGVRRVDGQVTPIPWPGGLGNVIDLRMASLGEDRSAWIFERVSSTDPRVAESLGMSHAELEGTTWTRPRVLPLEGGVDVWFPGSGSILPGAEPGDWLVPTRADGGSVGLLSFRRGPDGWRAVAVDDRWGPIDGLEALRSGRHASGVSWIVLTGAELDADARPTVRLARGAGSAEVRRIHVGAPDEAVRFPEVAVARDGPLVGWVTVTPERTLAGMWHPRMDGAALVEPGAERVVPVALPDGSGVWVVARSATADVPAAIDVYRAGGAVPELIGFVPNPYSGYFGVAADAPEELTLVGPEMNPDPAYPAVRSLVLRLSLDCT